MAKSAAVSEIQSMEGIMNELSDVTGVQNITDLYGRNVFSLKAMRNYLSESL